MDDLAALRAFIDADPELCAIDWRDAIAAALLHDVVNLPKDHPDRAEASTRSADVARELPCG